MIEDPVVLKKLAGIKEIPTLPEVLQDVLRVMASNDSSAGDLAAILSKDQALCSKILRFANSAFFAQSRRIFEIDEAVVLLGFDSVSQLMLATTVLSAFGPAPSHQIFDAHGFWKHSIAVAIGSKMIAQIVGESYTRAMIYTAGLLHDIGKLVLITNFPAQYVSVLKRIESEDLFLYEAELLILGFTHCDISEWVCNRWSFPEELVHLIARHHDEVCAPPRMDRGPCIIRLADIVCNRLQIGSSGNTKTYPLSSAEYAVIGLKQDDIAAIEEGLETSRDEIESILKAIT